MNVEVRNGKVLIDGYVNAVDRFSKKLRDRKGNFIEKIMPHTFERAIQNNNDIKVLLNHNYEKQLATTKDNTAMLYEDNIGLRAKVEVTDSEVIEKAKNNKLSGWSFGFICNDAETSVNSDGLEERIVKDIDLIEVSILDNTTQPAYIGTSIEMRDGSIKEVLYRNAEETPVFNKKEDDEIINLAKEMTEVIKELKERKINYSTYEERIKKINGGK